MTDATRLVIDGEVRQARELGFADLAAIGREHQLDDVSTIDPKRAGGAVRLEAVLALAQPKPTGTYLTLHAEADDFHASVPLSAVSGRAWLVYRLDDGPLPAAKGGPVRMLIEDPAACHSAEVDECASVKFVDRIELSAGRGYDNRPADESAHAELHRRQDEAR